VYRSEWPIGLKELGYEIERGESSQPEIKGYSKEYLEASSPRRQQIEEHLAREISAAREPRKLPHTRHAKEAGTVTRRDARPAQGNGRAVRQSTRASC